MFDFQIIGGLCKEHKIRLYCLYPSIGTPNKFYWQLFFTALHGVKLYYHSRIKAKTVISYNDTLTILKYAEDIVTKEECSTVKLINTAVNHSSIDNIDDEMESIFYTFQTQIDSNQTFVPNKLQQIQLTSKRIIPGQLKNCLKFPSRKENDFHSCQDILILN